MNRVVISLALICLTLSFHLDVKQRIDFNGEYKLTCSGSKGLVSFGAEDLPNGLELRGDTLSVRDRSALRDGYYPVKLTAEDEANFDSRVVLIVISRENIQSSNAGSSQQAAGSAAISSEVSNPEKVNSVLSGLDVPLSISAEYEYPEVGYPTGNLPTGINKNVPNYTPSRIASHQATASAANRNQITSDDVRSHSIFERQLNAAKALANLLSIVKQATANKNVALQEIDRRTQIHQQAVSVQRIAQEKVLEAENNLARIRKGIETTNERIDTIRNEINDLVNEQEKKKIEKQSLVTGVAKAQKSLIDVNKEIKLEDEKLAKAERDLADKEAECEGLKIQISFAEEDIASKRIERAGVSVELDKARVNVQEDKDAVNEIRRRLAEAQAALKQSESALGAVQQRAASIDSQISSIQNKLNDLSQRLNQCQAELASFENRVNELKNEIIPALNAKKGQIESEISRLQKEIASITEFLERIPGEIQNLEVQLQKMMESLRYLRSQVFIFEKELRGAYAEGNAANEKVEEAKVNLEAANKRYLDETNIIEEATRNIEEARVQKSQADLAVENYLREGVDILPFAAAPGEEGFEPIGTGEYAIKSWSEFVRIAYGNVEPIFIGTLDKLYEFKLQNAQGEGDCESSELKAVSGYILQVLDDRFVMITNEGKQYAISYSACIVTLANIQSYSLNAGDVVALKGIAVSDTEIQATQLSCIRR